MCSISKYLLNVLISSFAATMIKQIFEARKGMFDFKEANFKFFNYWTLQLKEKKEEKRGQIRFWRGFFSGRPTFPLTFSQKKFSFMNWEKRPSQNSGEKIVLGDPELRNLGSKLKKQTSKWKWSTDKGRHTKFFFSRATIIFRYTTLLTFFSPLEMV